MLPKSERLTKSQVEAVLASGKKHSSKYFFATVLKGGASLKGEAEVLTSPSFAVVVSKKTAASAVDRNRLRRQTYNAIKEVKKIILARPTGKIYPAYAVLTVKREAKGVKFPALIDDIGQLFKISGTIA